MFGRKKGNYLIVCHLYWMHHKCFKEKLLIDVTDREAQGEAAFLLPDTVQAVTK